MSSILSNATKTCSTCETEKSLNEFYNFRKGKFGKTASCKVCRRAYFVQRRIDNPEKVKVQESRNYHKHKHKHKQRNIEYRQNNKLKFRKAILKHKHNLTIEQWDSMYIEQGGRCAICGKHQSEISGSLCVDHNHNTNKIRGLLCGKCNAAIGLMDENLDVLSNAIKYIREQ